MFSRDGVLIGEFGEKKRTPVTYEQVPPDFIHAILAAEDDTFLEHHGVDLTGLLRAASELASTGSIRSGGSTITMQVAKNYFLSRERTFTRKFTEIMLALQIDQKLSKQEILELYVNKIYLGNRAYGIGAAAQIYYGKSIDQLELAQLAMIAGLPKAPSSFNPLVNPERALERRNWILTTDEQARVYRCRRVRAGSKCSDHSQLACRPTRTHGAVGSGDGQSPNGSPLRF